MTPARTLVRMQFGSHVYGTNVPTSDLDFKAVHVPAAEDILLQRAKPAISVSTKEDSTQKNVAGDTDSESFALQKYLAMLLEGQTVALTMLFVPNRWIIEQSSEWAGIREQKDRWLHRGVSAFAGYCRQQANKYGIKGSRVAATRTTVRRQRAPRSARWST
jgi:predicted nucleotidyltransferase